MATSRRVGNYATSANAVIRNSDAIFDAAKKTGIKIFNVEYTGLFITEEGDKLFLNSLDFDTPVHWSLDLHFELRLWVHWLTILPDFLC